MNIWKPTGEKNLSFPQWVDRLVKENQKLLRKLKEYEDRERAERGDGSGQEAPNTDEEGRSEGLASKG